MTRLTLGGAELVVHEIENGGDELELFRIVRGDQAEQPAFLDSFRSHYELGLPPRGTERRAAVIHMGLSTYRAVSQARGTATRFPAIGSHLARLRLTAGHGLNFADTGHPGHVTLWGDPVVLVDSVVEVEPVEG